MAHFVYARTTLTVGAPEILVNAVSSPASISNSFRGSYDVSPTTGICSISITA